MIYSRFLCTEVTNSLPYLYHPPHLSGKPVLDSYALSYNSQARYHLTTSSKHVKLAFTSPESETRRYASQQVYSKDICEYARIRCPGSDIFWNILCHASNIATTILFDIGNGNKKLIITIARLTHHYTKEMCEAMLGLH